MDMSLDEIINTRRNKTSVRGRRNINRPGSNREELNGRINRAGIRRPRPNSSNPSSNRYGVNRPASVRPGLNRLSQSNIRDRKQIDDARTRIIQKNRQKVADARDKLAEIAKKSDARLKLLKLKQTTTRSPVNMKNNILKTRISNSPRQNTRPLNRDRFRGRGGIDQGFSKELGRISQMRERLSQSPRGADLKRSVTNDLITKNRNQGLRFNFRDGHNGPVLKRSIDNDDFGVVSNPVVWRESNNEGGYMSVPLGAMRTQEGLFQRNRFHDRFSNDGNVRANLDMEEELMGNDELSLMRTFSNQRSRSEMDNFSSKVTRPDQIKVVMHNDSPTFFQKQQHQMMEIAEEYDPYFKQPTRPLAMAKSASRDDHLVHRGSLPRMSQEMLARLDTPAPLPRSMGILSSQGPQPVSMNADIGHRIVVSNLQQSVTHEDIKELFEDIGPLLASRVVRPGTAEVIYSIHKDAKKAVEAYHNRQLDGQPMKCMLVNPRALPMNTGSVGSLRSPALQAKIPSSSKSSVMPDLTAIHKALFSK